MSQAKTVTIDGNQAAATIAHLTNEVIAIYPITPSSNMGEFADEWSANGQANLWGSIPKVVEMQSEGGAAGAIHGALQAGALATTFTASQGLLLMIPNMYKIAGELTPTVFHIAARSLACQGLSIFGDHSDVMSTRQTGFAMLASNCPQEVMDMALIAQSASLVSRVPFLHFFDGFRTSHEVAKLETVPVEVVRALIDDEAVQAHRGRAMSPAHPVLRGSSQNPDVYFQARETVNPHYSVLPQQVQEAMDQFASLTGRQYRLFQYEGVADAERVIVIMGSGAEAVHETVNYLSQQGERVGVLKVRLYRPFSPEALLQALPESVRSIAVLDRTKEPGADGEPLYKDVVTALAQDALGPEPHFDNMPRVVGGRYGLSSKEFTPGMIKAVFEELDRSQPRNQFTVGIHDDLSHTSIEWDDAFRTTANEDTFQAVFYGLGSDGTVSANKNSIKIIGESTDLHAQGYFVYDSKKSGAVTVSHLRFGPDRIRSSYLIGEGDARFVACHQPTFLEKYDMLSYAREGAVFLLNSPAAPDALWQTLPASMQQQIIDKRIKLYSIDAYDVAQRSGMGKRINTIMQTCFFAISGILPREQAVASIKQAVEKTYGRKGRRIIELNFKAIDETLACLHEISIGGVGDVQVQQVDTMAGAPDFVRKVTAEIIAGRGDQIPVSLLPEDGSFPLGTAAYEKRNLALEIPVWETDLCTQCGKCPFVCPHSAIRSKVFHESELQHAPPTFKSALVRAKGFPEGYHISYQVAPEDCTGCTLCVDICPIRDKSNVSRKALNMAPQPALRAAERDNWDFFTRLPEYDRTAIRSNTIAGSMIMQPLFEFSGACVGCGETPYVKLATQLFGDRMLVANATGCSSIYGGNLPTTPYTTTADGRGPSWNNSLFEDNAEFGLGMRLAVDKQREMAQELLRAMRGDLDPVLVDAILAPDETSEAGVYEQRERVAQLDALLHEMDSDAARQLLAVSENLCRKSVWIVGGDGWAYDIGYGGVDHVLASGADVNLLVLDTEVYSNTGGQTSKATPRGAVAKFSSGGKTTGKKDLALLAMEYENVYVARVAYGGKDTQTLNAFLEAEAHPGPSLILALSPCIAHGVDMSRNHQQQDMAVKSGHWPLFRFNPENIAAGKPPMKMDSRAPSIPYRDYVQTETRFNMLWHTHPEVAEALVEEEQKFVNHRYHYYEQLSKLDWSDGEEVAQAKAAKQRVSADAPNDGGQ
ncbi:pyruvate:ferredoxin (flavodoxin) oxidoreductase [Pseudohalioglobus sediminis]|uniref:Pyruvate-flavodoxin oxidoreductase n=1 Tax=Pseudohalioglobus sediminis TaxID=2606449 RepID=A0A5B0WMA3_9GAMM|nr:pyruvate:ferredoxin (flavodoxin) oxidoreductase [Pseudohalioglobus sediminis]KAA1188174.1 pyruvate:ferredoxin (flavodoxin) oxidoreductase [Pseudohalioglobus sediminis]